MKVDEKIRKMAKYDRNLAQLYYIAFVELAGYYTGPQLIVILRHRGEKLIEEGGWVPKTGKSILGMLKRAQAIADEVMQEQT